MGDKKASLVSTTRKFTFNMSSTNDLAHSLLSMYMNFETQN